MRLKGTPILFADDSTIFYNGPSLDSNINDMQYDLERVTEYFRLNKLALNLSKTKVMHFGTKNTPSARRTSLIYNNITIDAVEKTKYLGVLLDYKLQWTDHIDAICKKIAGTVGILSKLGSFVPSPVLKDIYYALVHSRIEYCAFAWSAAPCTHIRRLQTLQNRALKRCFGLHNRYNTFELFVNYANDVIPVKALGEYQYTILAHAVWYRSIHTGLAFHKRDNNHNTRQKGMLLDIPRANSKKGQGALSIRGATYFNALPPDLQSIRSPILFRRGLKRIMMESDNLNRLFGPQ